MSLKKNLIFSNSTWHSKKNDRLKNKEYESSKLECSKTNSSEELS